MLSRVFVYDRYLLETKCVKCTRYLSVPPIVIELNNPVCGRCVQHHVNWEENRAYFYENIAQFMFFPCANDAHGCPVQSPWGKVLAHESECQFGVTICPAVDCEEKVSKKTVVNHFEIDHNHLILKHNEYPLTYSADEYLFMNKLFVWNGQPLIVQTKNDGLDVFFRISSFEEHVASTVNLKLSINSKQSADSVCLNEFSVMKYDSKLPVYSIKEKIRINYLRNILGSELRCIFKLKEITKTHNNDASNDKMLYELECPVCTDYMTLPIYMCSTGHSICRKCKMQLSKCPSCSANFTNARNFTLEKITEFVVYPCTRKNQGCDFTGNLNSITQHESTCKISRQNEISCIANHILPCKWKGEYAEMYQHLRLDHPVHCVDVRYPLYVDISSCTQLTVFIKYDNDIFKLCVYWILTDFGVPQSHWAVVYIQDTDKATDEYMFYLEFENDKRTLTLSEVCVTVSTGDKNQDWLQYINIPFNLLDPFVVNQKLIFKLNLVKLR